MGENSVSDMKEYYEIYDELVLKMMPFYPEMHREIVESIDKLPDERFRVLELGFGTGTLTWQIFSRFSKVEIFGIDSNRPNIEKALEKLNGKKFEYQVGDFSKLKVDGKFDVIISALAVHHLSPNEKKLLFKQTYDLLNESGRLIIGDIVKSKKEEGWHKYLVKNMGDEGGARWQNHKNNGKDKPSTLAEQIKWLKEAGFDRIKIVKEWYNFAIFWGEKL